jgi:hypothetical protein
MEPVLSRCSFSFSFPVYNADPLSFSVGFAAILSDSSWHLLFNPKLYRDNSAFPARLLSNFFAFFPLSFPVGLEFPEEAIVGGFLDMGQLFLRDPFLPTFHCRSPFV